MLTLFLPFLIHCYRSSSPVGADRPESSEPLAATSHTQETTDKSTLEEASPLLPQISPDTDFGLDLHSIISAGDPECAVLSSTVLQVIDTQETL